MKQELDLAVQSFLSIYAIRDARKFFVPYNLSIHIFKLLNILFYINEKGLLIIYENAIGLYDYEKN